MSTQSVETETESNEPEMSLLDHLRELRNRAFVCAVAVVITTSLSLVYTEQILKYITSPLPRQLIVTNPLEGLTNTFTVSLTVGVALALPVLLYEIIAFIMPGLLPREKRWLAIGLPFSLVMFIVGASFAWFVFVPSAISFLTGIYTDVFLYQLKPDEYIPFVSGVVFWMGVAFQLPIIMFLLAKFNVVSARMLRSNWRYALVIIAIVAAFITPTPDPINMSLVMLPLSVLYVLSIGMAALARRGATIPAMLDPDEKVAEDTSTGGA